MTEFFIFLLCVLFSAFFSGSEMAFVSSNKLKLREMADNGNKAALKALRLQDYPHHFLTMILIMNNVVNITATSVIAYWLAKNFGIQNEWVVTAITVPVLIIFGETVPKDYCRIRSKEFLLVFAPVLDFFLKLFQKPAVLILKGVDAILVKWGGSSERSIFVSEEEFRFLIEESTKSGLLNKHEKQLVDTILDFERIHVESVMTPVEKVAKVEISRTCSVVRDLARSTHSRMVLVYEEIPSIIVGMIYVFDTLFETDDQKPLQSFLRSPIFIPRTMSIEKAFLTLQQKRQSFAVVTDSSGEVIGVVPIERLFTL